MNILSHKFGICNSVIDGTVNRILNKTEMEHILQYRAFSIVGGSSFLNVWNPLARGNYAVKQTIELANGNYLVTFSVHMYHVTHSIFNRLMSGHFTLNFTGDDAKLLEL